MSFHNLLAYQLYRGYTVTHSVKVPSMPSTSQKTSTHLRCLSVTTPRHCLSVSSEFTNSSVVLNQKCLSCWGWRACLGVCTLALHVISTTTHPTLLVLHFHCCFQSPRRSFIYHVYSHSRLKFLSLSLKGHSYYYSLSTYTVLLRLSFSAGKY